MAIGQNIAAFPCDSINSFPINRKTNKIFERKEQKNNTSGNVRSKFSYIINTTKPVRIQYSLGMAKTTNNYMKLMSRLIEIQRIGDEWDSDFNTAGPTEEVLSFSRDLIKKMVGNDMMPIRMTQTVEEGICFVFQNNRERLYLEIYNDGDVGFISENIDTKNVIDNEIIEDGLYKENEIIKSILNFYNN